MDDVLVTSPHCRQVLGTGYGSGGRLGIGGTDCASTPTLLESLQHVFIKKVGSTRRATAPRRAPDWTCWGALCLYCHIHGFTLS